MNTQNTTKLDIVHDIAIQADIATVYSAAKTYEGIKGWWNTRCEVSEEVGGRSQMNFNKDGNEIVMAFRIDELSENQRVAWTCIENGNPYWVNTKIAFEMKEGQDGTQFRFVHGGFAEAGYSEEMHQMIAGGWQHFMNSFQAWCETGEGQPWA